MTHWQPDMQKGSSTAWVEFARRWRGKRAPDLQSLARPLSRSGATMLPWMQRAGSDAADRYHDREKRLAEGTCWDHYRS